MRTHPILPSAASLGALLLTAEARAQDIDAMARWTAYEVVHYHVVGKYAGDTKVLLGKQGLFRAAPVTDRVEIDFDWNQQAMKLVGTPTIKNFPSTVGTLLPVTGCPAAKVDGAYEMATVTTVADMGAMSLTLASTRSFPPGSIPLAGDMEPCGTAWEAVTPSTAPASDMMTVPPAMMVVMAGMGGYPVTPDGKSLLFKGGDTGINATGLNDWEWTFTPTPVK